MKRPIVLNEKKCAEEIIATGKIVGNIYYTLSLIARYYYNAHGYRTKRIQNQLHEFMDTNYEEYRITTRYWDSVILKIAANTHKLKLYEIQSVAITQAELKTIDGIENKVLQRLAFTYLCLAKLNYLKKPETNGWVSLDDKYVFKMAHINCTIGERDDKIAKLAELGLLRLPKKNGCLSVQVTFMDTEGEGVLSISDFRELGYEYLKYLGENYIRCQECGVLTKGNKNGTKRFCTECTKYIPMETRIICCIDCGESFTVSAKNHKTVRCAACQKEYRKQYDRERKKNSAQQMKDEQKIDVPNHQ